ncbi:hypothetical protein [Oscillibacter sp.]|uniref:hypothetical protein n=1 Tax=Oscillibacter sp. TaxID=1945593 RepID=UPI002D80D11A|nr:hypothetical protein [Oscillibacter sp.]
MENYSFKSVAFGGFDKQDVVRYLEQSSEKAAAARRELEAENETLHRQAADQMEELDRLRVQVEELTEERDRLREKLQSEAAGRVDPESLRALEQDAARIAAERDALKPDAEAYARFRERLGAIECEARKRADDLEEEAAAQTRRTVGEFLSQYQRLVSAFESTAGHVNGELRKIEVMLSQLPRALDQTGTELGDLAARLEKKTEAKDKE